MSNKKRRNNKAVFRKFAATAATTTLLVGLLAPAANVLAEALDTTDAEVKTEQVEETPAPAEVPEDVVLPEAPVVDEAPAVEAPAVEAPVLELPSVPTDFVQGIDPQLEINLPPSVTEVLSFGATQRITQGIFHFDATFNISVKGIDIPQLNLDDPLSMINFPTAENNDLVLTAEEFALIQALEPGQSIPAPLLEKLGITINYGFTDMEIRLMLDVQVETTPIVVTSTGLPPTGFWFLTPDGMQVGLLHSALNILDINNPPAILLNLPIIGDMLSELSSPTLLRWTGVDSGAITPDRVRVESVSEEDGLFTVGYRAEAFNTRADFGELQILPGLSGLLGMIGDDTDLMGQIMDFLPEEIRIGSIKIPYVHAHGTFEARAFNWDVEADEIKTTWNEFKEIGDLEEWVLAQANPQLVREDGEVDETAEFTVSGLPVGSPTIGQPYEITFTTTDENGKQQTKTITLTVAASVVGFTEGTIASRQWTGDNLIELSTITMPVFEGVPTSVQDQLETLISNVRFADSSVGEHGILYDFNVPGFDILKASNPMYSFPDLETMQTALFADSEITPFVITDNNIGGIGFDGERIEINKVYDGNTDADLPYQPVFDGLDGVEVAVAFDDQNVGGQVVITGISNWSHFEMEDGMTAQDLIDHLNGLDVFDSSITPAPLTFTTGTIEGKVFDGTTAITGDIDTDGLGVVGVVTGEVIEIVGDTDDLEFTSHVAGTDSIAGTPWVLDFSEGANPDNYTWEGKVTAEPVVIPALMSALQITTFETDEEMETAHTLDVNSLFAVGNIGTMKGADVTLSVEEEAITQTSITLTHELGGDHYDETIHHEDHGHSVTFILSTTPLTETPVVGAEGVYFSDTGEFTGLTSGTTYYAYAVSAHGLTELEVTHPTPVSPIMGRAEQANFHEGALATLATGEGVEDGAVTTLEADPTPTPEPGEGDGDIETGAENVGDPSGKLPQTGANNNQFAAMGAGLLGLGALAAWIKRVRKSNK